MTKRKKAGSRRGVQGGATRPAKAIDPTKPCRIVRNEGVAQDVAAGMRQHDAYVKNYPHCAKWKKRSSVDEAASKLCAKIAPRIEHLKEQLAQTAWSDKIASKEEACSVLTEMLRVRHSDFLTKGADGEWFHDIGPETLNQAGLKKTKTRVSTDEHGNTVIQRQFDEIELESKVAVVRELSEIMGWHAPRRIAGADGGPLTVVHEMPDPDPA